MSLTASQKMKVIEALQHHFHHKHSYYWNGASFGKLAERKKAEKKLNFVISFINKGDRYQYESCVFLSAAHYYYTGVFSLNGKRKNVTLFKKLLNISSSEPYQIAVELNSLGVHLKRKKREGSSI